MGPAKASLDEVLKAMVDSQHSRLPVWEEKPEQMIGVIFFKDMLRLLQERRVTVRAGVPHRRFNWPTSCESR